MSALAGERLVTPLGFRSAERSHAGGRPEENQDRLLDRPDRGLWAIADGMGGHADGAAAAQAVIDALDGVSTFGPAYSRLAELERCVAAQNARLFARGAGRGRTGATLVALLAHGGHAACLWAGDSRAYLLRAGRLAPLTRDHSLVQDLIDGGALDERARRRHPGASVITRAIGGAAELVLDRRFVALEATDRLLLCSDGLTVAVDEHEIAEASAVPVLADAADRLLALALARDTPDNVSLVLIEAL